MNGSLAKASLLIGVFLAAGIGFFTHNADAIPDHNPPRMLRDIEHAASTGDLEELGAILRIRPDLVNISTYGGPPLHIAARYNHPVVIKYLLDHGADPNGRAAANGVKQCNALHWACLWGSKEAAEALINEGFAIEDRNNYFKCTPLYWVALGSWELRSPEQQGDYQGTVQMLIEHGAAVNISDVQGRSAVSVASDEVAKVLVAHGAANPRKALPPSPSTRPASNDEG